MGKFRKKPVVIEAEQFDGHRDVPGVWRRPEDNSPYVVTIHGQPCYIKPGDWIIPEPDGVHYYPVKPDIFEATYEPAEPTCEPLPSSGSDTAEERAEAVMQACFVQDDPVVWCDRIAAAIEEAQAEAMERVARRVSATAGGSVVIGSDYPSCTTISLVPGGFRLQRRRGGECIDFPGDRFPTFAAALAALTPEETLEMINFLRECRRRQSE